jgi:hypothetical protein
MLYAGATGAAARDPDAVLSPVWREAWCADFFGVPGGVSRIDEALEAFGKLSEFDAGAERPITLVIHGYMDVLLAMTDLAERKAVGALPPDFSEVDFGALFAKKLALVRQPAFRAGATALLIERLSGYEKYAGVFVELARRATAHRAEADYWLLASELRLVHARIMLRLIAGEPVAGADCERWAALGPRLQSTMKDFVDGADLATLSAMWWAPTARLIL